MGWAIARWEESPGAASLVGWAMRRLGFLPQESGTETPRAAYGKRRIQSLFLRSSPRNKDNFLCSSETLHMVKTLTEFDPETQETFRRSVTIRCNNSREETTKLSLGGRRWGVEIPRHWKAARAASEEAILRVERY